MRKRGESAIFLVATIMLIVALLSFAGCSPEEHEPTYEFDENMSPKDICQLLYNAHSFSVQTEECDYRLLKTEGFSISEFGKYEAYFVNDDTVCHIKVDENGEKIELLPIDDEYYQMVEEVYYQYVEHVSATYGLNPSSNAQLDIKVTNGEAQVTTIWRKSAGELDIMTCRLFGINNTQVYVPPEYEYLYVAKK